MVEPRASPVSKPVASDDWNEDPAAIPAPDEGRSRPGASAALRDQGDSLPPWARFPHVDARRDGPAFDDRDASVQETWAEETERVLRQIDGLRDEVQSRARVPLGAPDDARPVSVDAPLVADPEPARAPMVRASPAAVELLARPRSYLEERLRLADADVSAMGQDVRAISETWMRVHDRMERLEAEVRAAHEEIGLVHSPAHEPEPAARERRSGSPTPSARPAASTPAPEATRSSSDASIASPWSAFVSDPYAGYTAEKYNRTIGALKARRRKLAGWTLLAAGLISLVLVAVTATAKEAMPPLWLAVLPVVWMIPVPFFVLSFRGTQRVLRHNHLEVPGGPP